MPAASVILSEASPQQTHTQIQREAGEAENKKGSLGMDMYAHFKAASCQGWESQGAQSPWSYGRGEEGK